MDSTSAPDSQFTTIFAEAGCDRSLNTWLWYSDRLGTNDLTVLENEPFLAVLDGRLILKKNEGYCNALAGIIHHHMYFLGDGIYLEWSIFLKPVHEPHDKDGVRYNQKQEAVRKDIERAFGALQSRF